MSWINDTLQEEKERTLRFIQTCEQEIAGLPKGYISEKNIRGKKTYYLQWREGSRIKSQYVKKGDVEALVKKIEKRKTREQQLKRHKQNLKQLERMIKID